MPRPLFFALAGRPSPAAAALPDPRTAMTPMAGATLIFDGALTADRAGAIQRQMLTALHRAAAVTVDCRAATAADLSFLQLLAAADATARSAARSLTLETAPAGAVAAALERGGFAALAWPAPRRRADDDTAGAGFTAALDAARRHVLHLLTSLEQTLLDLDQAPADHHLVEHLCRTLGVIRGAAVRSGIAAAAGFAHHVETAFDRLCHGGSATPPLVRPLVGAALAARHHLRGLIEEPDMADLTIGDYVLGEIRAALPPAAVTAPEPVSWAIHIRPGAGESVSRSNPLQLLDDLRPLGRCTVTVDCDAVPPLDRLDPDACHLRWTVMLSTRQPRPVIERLLQAGLTGMALSMGPALP